MEAASVGSTGASSWTNCLSGHDSCVVAVVGMGWGGLAGRLSTVNTASVVGPAKKRAAEGGSRGTGEGHGSSTKVGKDVGGGIGGFWVRTPLPAWRENGYRGFRQGLDRV